MWFLTNNKTQYVYYLVSSNPCHTVGRAGTDLIITGDDSISRNHATLQPRKEVLQLSDTGSRYGSYVNDNINKIVPISKDQPTELKVGDQVRFGRIGSIWTVGKANFRCLTSTLTMDDQLKAVLQKIGADLLPLYTRGLTHLIMPTITVTSKFLQCMVGQVSIVKPDYFHAIDRDCIGKGKALPMAKDFLPTCTESYIRNDPILFHPNPVRSTLFRGKEFIFLNTTQQAQFENIVQLAGGVCVSAQREKVAKSRFLKPNVVTVKLKQSGSSQSQTLDTLSRYITSRGRRMVPDLEIGLAIIFCSTEKYCNPDYNFAYNVEECHSSAEGGETMAKSTEEQTEREETTSARGVEINTIPETENLTEQKEITATSNKPPTVVKTNNVSARSTSSFVVPAPVPPCTSVPEERRTSKRMQETEKSKAQVNGDDKDSSHQPKRPRRTVSSAEISVTKSPKMGAKAAASEPEESEITVPETQPSSKMGAKVAASEPEESEITVPETQPSANSVLSQAPQTRGFRGVNRDSMASEPRAVTNKEVAKTRRAAVVFDDEDMFDFDEIAPRKKTRLDKGNGKSNTASNGRHNPSSASEKQEELFSFDKVPSTQERRNQRQTNGAQNRTQPSSSSDASLSRAVESVPQNRTNNSTTSDYKAFIKPIQPPSMTGWLSSTLCGLKLNDGGGSEEEASSEIKIKSEPLDETDCKKSVTNEFSVREVNMRLVGRRPIDESGQEVSCAASDGGKNFKAFVKKRNYPVQNLVIPTKSVGARDDFRCA